MPLGTDKQYDLSWAEQDKVRRRLEIKNRLKEEGVRKKFDPYKQMHKELFTDPSVERYVDLRKKGRMPGAPIKPKIFFTMLSMLVIPIGLMKFLITNERKDFLAACETGDYPIEKRWGKSHA